MQVGLGLALRMVVAAFMFRGVAAVAIDPGRFGGEMGWVARSLALGHGFSSPFLPMSGPTALVPPLFPCLLAVVFRVFGLYSVHSAAVILGIDSLLSALTCVPVYFLARDVFGTRLARLAGWVWVLYPTAIYFSGAEVWDYALTAFLFANCLWALAQIRHRSELKAWLGVGVLCGVALLSNPAVLSVMVAVAALALWQSGMELRRIVLRSAVLALGCLAVVTPWMARNSAKVHVLSPIRDGFWLEFWAGNCGDTVVTNPPEAHPATNPAEMQRFLTLGEKGYLAEKRAMSIAVVERHPIFVAKMSVRRAVRFWTGYWSFRRDYLHREPFDLPNVFFCTGLTLLMLRGLGRLWRENRRGALAYMALVVLFPLPYYLTHASMDYRQPMEPEVAILVAAGLSGAGEMARRMRLRVRASEASEAELQLQ